MGFLNNLKRTAGQRVTMKVCMMGPRAVGKTTVLTAMFNETQNSIASTNLLLHAKGDTNAEIIDRTHKLSHIFAKKIQINDRPDAGIAATSAVHTFDFSFGLKGKEPRIDLEIKDFPGEYVRNNQSDVISFINESNAIIVAIDAPHLMEAGSKYCEAKNRINDITTLFKECFSYLDSEKLVLLTPLKCEKYYFTKQMPLLLQKVEQAYAELINFFQSDDKVACAITPILTLGGVEFNRFETSNGVVGLTMDNCPDSVLYKFRMENPKYNPTYCVQPLYYLLSFVSAQYQRNKNNLSFFNRLLSNIFSLFANNPELYGEILKMERYRGIDIPGYKTICGKNKFHYNR